MLPAKAAKQLQRNYNKFGEGIKILKKAERSLGYSSTKTSGINKVSSSFSVISLKASAQTSREF